MLINLVEAVERGVIGAYYAQVYALTPKEEVIIRSSEGVEKDLFKSTISSPDFVLVLFGIFIFLLSGAIIIQAVNKVLDYKRTIMTLIVCLMVISVPLLMRNALYSTFQLRAGPQEAPRNIELKQNSPSSIKVSWETQEPRTGAVRVGKAPLNLDQSRVTIGDQGKLTKLHSLEIDRLEAGFEYEAELLSGKTWYDDNGKPLKFILK